MAASMVPTDWIAGYSSDGTDMTIPIASVPELSAAEAHTSTGSFSNILYALLHLAYSVYARLTSKPSNMVLSKVSTVNESTGKIDVTFVARFTTSVAAGSQNVDAEA